MWAGRTGSSVEIVRRAVQVDQRPQALLRGAVATGRPHYCSSTKRIDVSLVTCLKPGGIRLTAQKRTRITPQQTFTRRSSTSVAVRRRRHTVCKHRET
jgi:hypothetical protein